MVNLGNVARGLCFATLAGADGKVDGAINGGATHGNPSPGGAGARTTKWMVASAGAQDGRKAAYLPFSGN